MSKSPPLPKYYLVWDYQVPWILNFSLDTMVPLKSIIILTSTISQDKRNK